MKKVILTVDQALAVNSVFGGVAGKDLTIDEIRKMGKTQSKLREANKEYLDKYDVLDVERNEIIRKWQTKFRKGVKNVEKEEVEKFNEELSRDMKLEIAEAVEAKFTELADEYKSKKIEVELSEEQYDLFKHEKFVEKMKELITDKIYIVDLLETIESVVSE